MEITVLVFGALAIILGTISCILFGIHFRDSGLWFGCASCVAVCITGTAGIQSHLRKADAAEAEEKAKAASQSAPSPQPPAEPPPLTPGSGPNPPINIPDDLKSKWKVADSVIFFALGNSVAWSSKPPLIVIAQRGEPMIVIDKDDSGAWVTANFFDKDGKLICQLVKNRLHVGDKVFRVDRSVPHKLAVIDHEARTVLEVEFVNPRAFHILGDFYLRRGVRCTITQNEQNLGGIRHSGSMAGDVRVPFMVN